jgi:hypothetical protein
MPHDMARETIGNHRSLSFVSGSSSPLLDVTNAAKPLNLTSPGGAADPPLQPSFQSQAKAAYHDEL